MSPPDSAQPPDGYLQDYISRQFVRATPEEKDAVQPMSRRLHLEYGYPRDLLRTRPQHRIRRSPSDQRTGYPVDIAIFDNALHSATNLSIVVECKSKLRKDGVTQLQHYLTLSTADIGIWYNGQDHAYLQKLIDTDGTLSFVEIPSIPRFGENVHDIDTHKRRDLRRPNNLRATFQDLRHHLAANNVGITRDEALAQQIINLLFCKIYDEINTPPNSLVTFRAGAMEPPETVRSRISTLFESVKSEFSEVFDPADSITLTPSSVVYVVGELQHYCVLEAERDAIGDAFEVFIGPALRGAEGQFFTPRNVVELIIKMIDPKPGHMIIDPACGSGGFLISTLSHVWQHINVEAQMKSWSREYSEARRREIATRYFRGIDKDAFLAKVTKAYMALIGDGRSGIFCENSLADPSTWSTPAQAGIELGTFDIVVTNPPFGRKMKIEDADILTQYSLGHKWSLPRDSTPPEQTTTPETSRPPQALFLERCLQFLKPGGKLGIVLPESLFGMPTHRYVVEYLMTNARVRGVIALPEPLFKTSGKGGTHTKVCILLAEKAQPLPEHTIFMADAEWCGHDSRGNPTVRVTPDGDEELLDDLPLIHDRFIELFGSADDFWEEPTPSL